MGAIKNALIESAIQEVAAEINNTTSNDQLIVLDAEEMGLYDQEIIGLDDQLLPIGIYEGQARDFLNSFYRCCFLKSGDEAKQPLGSAWQNNPRTADEYNGQGIGVICGMIGKHTCYDYDIGVYAIDADINDGYLSEIFSEAVYNFCLKKGIHGDFFERTGKAPKNLIPFYSTQLIKKMTSKVFYPVGVDPDSEEAKSQKCQVEILGSGNQFAAFQIHPETKKPYEWVYVGQNDYATEFFESSPCTLIYFTREQLEEIIVIFERLAEKEGLVSADKYKKAKKAPIKTRSTNQSGIIDLVNNSFDFPEILESFGYEHINKNAYLYPRSTTGQAGVYILTDDEGKERVYSHHSEDPLADGFAHDKFDVICMLQFDGDERAAIKHFAETLDPEGQKERQQEHMKQKAEAETLAELGRILDSAKAGEIKPEVISNGEKQYPFVMYDADTLASEAKAPAYIVDKVLETDSHGLCYGGSGSYKTFWALKLAHSVATGQPFMGNPVRRSGKVVFICGEGTNGIGRRVKALSLRYGSTEGNLKVITAGVDISNEQIMKLLGEALEQVKPELVIFDTFAALNGGIDENSPSEVGKLLRAVKENCRRSGASSLIVHHSGKDQRKGARGAGNFYNDMDFVYSIKREPNMGDRVIKVTTFNPEGKMKDGEAFVMTCEAFSVDLGIRDEDGKPVTSLIIDEPLGACIKGMEVATEKRVGQEGALLCLIDVYNRKSEALEGTGGRAVVTRTEWNAEMKAHELTNPAKFIKDLLIKGDKVEELKGGKFRPIF